GNSGEGPAITVESDREIPELPAAVEVAAYRIATEAITNAVRHSGARICTVKLKLNRDLVLEVLDDGDGLPQRYQAGVGLTSMRERAEELGGEFEILSTPEGTHIWARLPLEPL
ncbi:MAG TPA: ATP-binding protein, partial [Actinomycetota bacterium]|nr:ATP-binding protein [Actinomycetota bacterium]